MSSLKNLNTKPSFIAFLPKDLIACGSAAGAVDLSFSSSPALEVCCWQRAPKAISYLFRPVLCPGSHIAINIDTGATLSHSVCALPVSSARNSPETLHGTFVRPDPHLVSPPLPPRFHPISQVYGFDLSAKDHDLKSAGPQQAVPEPFHEIVWGPGPDTAAFPLGLIAGALLDGSVCIWDPHAIVNPSSVRFLTPHSLPLHHITREIRKKFSLSFGS